MSLGSSGGVSRCGGAGNGAVVWRVLGTVGSGRTVSGRVMLVCTASRAAAGVGSISSITGGDAVFTGSAWLGGRRVRNSAGS